MNCTVCREGALKPGTETLVFERQGSTVVIQQVPAQVCENCGESYVDERAAAEAMREAEASILSGKAIDVRRYEAA